MESADTINVTRLIARFLVVATALMAQSARFDPVALKVAAVKRHIFAKGAPVDWVLKGKISANGVQVCNVVSADRKLRASLSYAADTLTVMVEDNKDTGLPDRADISRTKSRKETPSSDDAFFKIFISQGGRGFSSNLPDSETQVAADFEKSDAAITKICGKMTVPPTIIHQPPAPATPKR